MPRIFIFSGTVGAGKDSVLEAIRKKRKDLYWAITTTSKQPREDESQGHPYYFISKEKFLKMVSENEFLEYQNVYGEKYYGMTKTEIELALKKGKDIIWQIDYRGHRTIRKIFPKEITSIFILPPSLTIAKERILRRSQVSAEFVQERLALAKKEIKASVEYDYQIVNHEGKLKETVEEVLKIIKKNS
jgi:guanylate kinase